MWEKAALADAEIGDKTSLVSTEQVRETPSDGCWDSEEEERAAHMRVLLGVTQEGPWHTRGPEVSNGLLEGLILHVGGGELATVFGGGAGVFVVHFVLFWFFGQYWRLNARLLRCIPSPFSYFELGSHYVAQAGLKLILLLPQSPRLLR